MARFRDAARALPDGVVTLNAAHQIEWANPTAELLLAIDAERDQGRAITNLVRNPDFVEYLRLGVYTAPLILRNVRGDASVLTVRAVAFGSERMLLLVRDITHEENIERLRRDFVANVSHELKTPITVLAGFVETLANPDIELEPAQRTHFLALMAEQSERMQRLIEDLLTLSALESAARPSTESIIEMPSLIQQVMPTIQALSDGKHQFICEVEALTLKGNAQEIISVISNLASNAVRYTPAGGTIRVTWTQRDEHAVLSVTDSGIGIEAQHLSRLTERFYRVDTSRSRESGGTGLGLAIVKHVLTRHQAKLEIHSTPGQGSTFSAVFPAQRVQPLHE
jgi:two-component system phosphate regulon sensor histidine kinase PhoR